MIASCPGEPLPDFPPFTHGPSGSGLKPYVSVNRTIAHIPAHIPNQEIPSMRHRMRPWDGSQIVPRCITTHGGQNYHPSGLRYFSNREFARLQGFPDCHVFSETNVKKQIGNAVPPSVAKILYEHIIRWLKKADGVVEEAIQID
jgi:DNA (cytosine-5)-methyltransferase 1